MQTRWIQLGLMGIGMGLILAGLGVPQQFAKSFPPPMQGPSAQKPQGPGPQQNQSNRAPQNAKGSHADYQPQEAQDSPEGKTVLAAGAKRLELSEFNSYGVMWFPPGYAKLPNHRVMLVIHGSNGNAYAGVYHQLEQAKKHQYGIIALQWWLGGDRYMDSRMTEAALYNLLMQASKQYPINTQQLGLETFSRSAAQALETVYWNRKLYHPQYKIVVLQSGGVPTENPMPLSQRLMSDKTVTAQFTGTNFFLYCGRKDEEWGEKMCQYVHNSEKIIQRQGGTVVQMIDDPNRGHGGMHLTPQYTQAETQAFLKATTLSAKP